MRFDFLRGVTPSIAVFQAEGEACPERSRSDLALKPAWRVSQPPRNLIALYAEALAAAIPRCLRSSCRKESAESVA